MNASVGLPLAGRTGYFLAPSATASLAGISAECDPELVAAMLEMTDDLVRDQIGRIEIVPAPQRLYGADAAAAMAGFVHWDLSPTPFSDGTRPTFSFALDRDVAIQASARKFSAFFSATREPWMDGAVAMTLYAMTLGDEVMDLRRHGLEEIAALVRAEAPLRSAASGFIYSDPDDPQTEWIAAFEARLIKACAHEDIMTFGWDGRSIVVS